MFDPFEKRASRDIRNRLSEYFLNTLAEGGWQAFEAEAQALRRGAPDGDHRAYIDHRMAAYLKVYNGKKGKNEVELARLLWDKGLFFECHEWVEPLWIAARGSEKKALQGIIRAAGARVLDQAGRRAPAISSAQKAAALIRAHGSHIPAPFNPGELIKALAHLLP
ncbi:MAG: DUF309 domain-containing protein [Desulfobacter sp.]|nr:MAG: DUF309 domain-containing protein [Desulfobacter sp.]